MTPWQTELEETTARAMFMRHVATMERDRPSECLSLANGRLAIHRHPPAAAVELVAVTETQPLIFAFGSLPGGRHVIAPMLQASGAFWVFASEHQSTVIDVLHLNVLRTAADCAHVAHVAARRQPTMLERLQMSLRLQ